MEYDKEENEILEAYGSGKIKLSKPSAKEIDKSDIAQRERQEEQRS